MQLTTFPFGTVHTFIDQHQHEYLADLIKFLQIPSISVQDEHMADVRQAATYVAGLLRECGMDEVHLIETNRAPIVSAEWLGVPDKPTVMIYGHYDVQPVDPIDAWTSPPFEPTIRNNKIFARGATDDKGQLMGLIQAFRAMYSVAGGFPTNVRFLIEGEEESGGAGIEDYILSHSREVNCDVVLIADTPMIAPNCPAIVYGVRGQLYVEIVAKGAATDLHSGLFGGVAPNPLHALAVIVAGIKGNDGKIQIPGLYDDVQPVSPNERRLWKGYAGTEQARLISEMGTSLFAGEQDYSLIERRSARTTFEVHGFVGGFQGEGSKAVIPAEARVKVSLRLVPNQDPNRILQLLRSRVLELAPPEVSIEMRLLQKGLGMIADTSNPYIQAAARSLTEEFHQETQFVRSGGSIPVAALFSSSLDIPVVFAGYGLPDENLHAPDEHFDLENYRHAMHGVVRYLQNIETLGQHG